MKNLALGVVALTLPGSAQEAESLVRWEFSKSTEGGPVSAKAG